VQRLDWTTPGVTPAASSPYIVRKLAELAIAGADVTGHGRRRVRLPGANEEARRRD